MVAPARGKKNKDGNTFANAKVHILPHIEYNMTYTKREVGDGMTQQMTRTPSTGCSAFSWQDNGASAAEALEGKRPPFEKASAACRNLATTSSSDLPGQDSPHICHKGGKRRPSYWRWHTWIQSRMHESNSGQMPTRQTDLLSAFLVVLKTSVLIGCKDDFYARLWHCTALSKLANLCGPLSKNAIQIR